MSYIDPVRSALVRAHGSDPIAYSTLQQGLSYFETSFGYIAFQPAFGHSLTLGPPICAPKDEATLIDRFLRNHRRPVFFYVQRHTADLVRQIGGSRFLPCGMGIDKVLDLKAQPSNPHPKVQGSLKKARKGNFHLVEVRPGSLSSDERQRIDHITNAYLQRSKVKVEMHFINHPLTFDDDGFSRMFLMTQGAENKIFGYLVLDPHFKDHNVHGYLFNLFRFESTRLWGVYYSVVASLMSTLQQEGIAQLSLGYCPLTQVDPEGCAPILSRQITWMAQKLVDNEYLSRLRALKEVFPGDTPQRYFVTQSPWAITTLLAFLRATRVPLWGIVREAFADD